MSKRAKFPEVLHVRREMRTEPQGNREASHADLVICENGVFDFEETEPMAVYKLYAVGKPADRVRAALNLRRESDPTVRALEIALEALDHEHYRCKCWYCGAIERMADILEGKR